MAITLAVFVGICFLNDYYRAEEERRLLRTYIALDEMEIAAQERMIKATPDPNEKQSRQVRIEYTRDRIKEAKKKLGEN